MKASESPYRNFEVITTGFPSLDRITGVGGVPRRRITEISGPYSVGKTTLALHIVTQAQKQGLRVLWSDIEWSWDEQYARALGVDLEAVDLIQERYAEAALDHIEEGMEAKAYDLVVIDSVGGLLPRQEAEKGAEGKVIGGQAKLVATFCRKVVPLLAINNIALLVLNHQFTDLMSGRLKTSGGAKLEYHKSLWLMLKKTNKRAMKGDQQVGEVVEVEIRKNKLAATMKQNCEMTMLYGSGFSAEADFLQELLDTGEVVKRGNTYFRGETKMGVGAAKAREFLKSSLGK